MTPREPQQRPARQTHTPGHPGMSAPNSNWRPIIQRYGSKSGAESSRQDSEQQGKASHLRIEQTGGQLASVARTSGRRFSGGNRYPSPTSNRPRTEEMDPDDSWHPHDPTGRKLVKIRHAYCLSVISDAFSHSSFWPCTTKTDPSHGDRPNTWQTSSRMVVMHAAS